MILNLKSHYDAKNQFPVCGHLTDRVSVSLVYGWRRQPQPHYKGRQCQQFSLSLGTPGDPFAPSPPTSPPYKACQRGPNERERDQQRAARHQAAKSTSPAESSVSSTDPWVGSPTSADIFPVTASVTASDHCNTLSMTGCEKVAASESADSTTTTASVATDSHKVYP